MPVTKLTVCTEHKKRVDAGTQMLGSRYLAAVQCREYEGDEECQLCRRDPIATNRYHVCSDCKKCIDYETGLVAKPSMGAEQLMMNMACRTCIAESRKHFMTEKPACSLDGTHRVCAVREGSTTEHFWTCVSCHVQIARAPDKDLEPTRFVIG